MKRSSPNPAVERRRQLASTIDRGEPIDWSQFEGDKQLAGFRLLDRVAQAHRSLALSTGAASGPPAETRARGVLTWGPFSLLEALGSGTFGEVFRAYDPVLDREVAVKLRRPGQEILSVRRHLEEARKLARVRHPNVLVVHGADIHDGRVGLWTDLVPGRTLASQLKAEGPFAPAEAVRIGIELCRALAAIHAAGLVHGDLKAANVLTETGTGRIILVDFGSATLSALEPEANPLALSGTPVAMAPELLRGEAPGPRSDNYALAVLLFELLTGTHPVPGKDLEEIAARHRRGERLRLHEIDPTLPAALVEVIEHALAARPEDRPATAEELGQLLSALAPGPGTRSDGAAESLRALAARLGKLPEALCRYLAREVAALLSTMHAAGRIHRTLSPDTIVVREGREIALLDEPLAPVNAAQLYAAPEELAPDLAIDGRADLFALGLVLCELSTGRHPFPAPDRAEYRRQVLAGWSPDPDSERTASADFLAVLARLLAPDPEARYRSASELAAALQGGGAKPIARRTARHHFATGSTEFIGREQELGQLLGCARAAMTGRGRVVLLIGREGHGKSRLLEELMVRIETESPQRPILTGSCAGGARSEGGPADLLAALGRHFGAGAESELTRLLPNSPLGATLLAGLLRGGRAADDSANELLSDRIPAVLAEVLLALASEHPIVIALDDLHLATTSELELFQTLARAAHELPMSVMAAARPGIDSGWLAEIQRLPETQMIELGELNTAETEAFLSGYLGSRELAEEWATELGRRSDGSPFVLLELLHALEARGWITRLPDQSYVATHRGITIAEIPLPDSVTVAIRQRVGRLSRLGRETLEMSTCAGIAFDPALVAMALGISPLVIFSELATLEQGGWITRNDLPGYGFVSDHVHEAIYRGLPEPLRQSNHLALAEARKRDMAPVGSGEPSAAAGGSAVELCTHFLRARRIDGAQPYLEPALARLAARCDRRAMLELTGEALVQEEAWSDRERITLHLRRASELEKTGRPAAARESYAMALLIAEADGDPELRAQVRIGLGSHLTNIGHTRGARTIFQQTVEIATGDGHEALLAQALGRLGLIEHRLGQSAEAVATTERALALATSIGEPRAACVAANTLGRIHHEERRLEAACRYFEQGLSLARSLGDPALEWGLCNNLGNVLIHLGDWAGAERYYEAQVVAARQACDPLGESLGAGSLARFLSRRGRTAEAMRLWARQATITRRHGYRRGEAAALGNLAIVCVHQGRLDEGRRYAVETEAIARQINAQETLSHAIFQQVGIAVYGGDRECALKLAEKWHISGLRDNKHARIGAIFWTGMMAEFDGDLAAATLAYDGALALARSISSPWQLAQLLIRSAVVLRPTAGERARILLEEVLAIAGEISHQSLAIFALTYLADLPGGDLQAAEAAYLTYGEQLSAIARTEVAFQLWKLTGKQPYLDQAHHTLISLRDHAPAEYRDSILEAVPLHRAIRAAWLDSSRASGS